MGRCKTALAFIFTGFLGLAPTAHAQIVSGLTEPAYLAVITNPAANGPANGPCGLGGSNGYLLCTGLGVPLGAFATAAQFGALSNTVAGINGRIDGAFAAIAETTKQLNHSVNQVNRGIAAVAALANSAMPSAPGRTTWALNGSVFLSEIGGGLSFAHRLSSSTPIAITGAYGNGGGNAHVGRVGLMGEF